MTMVNDRILTQLKGQNYRCAYPCAGDGKGGELRPGDDLALAYDNHGLIHLACAKVGTVPTNTDKVEVS